MTRRLSLLLIVLVVGVALSSGAIAVLNSENGAVEPLDKLGTVETSVASSTARSNLVAELEDRVYKYAGTPVMGLDLLEGVGYACIGLDEENTVLEEEEGGPIGSDGYTQPATLKRQNLDALGTQLYDCMVACMPERGEGWSSAALGAGRPCINTQLSKASKTWDSTMWIPVVEALVHDHPELEDVCHEGAHDAGKHVLLVRKEPMLAALKRLPGTCVSGFRHGLLDAVGFVETSVEELIELGDLCRTLGEAAPDCTHGLGHAAWDGTGSLENAVRVCASLSENDMQLCSYGIVMRRFQRDLALFEASDIPKLVKDAAELCRAWPDMKTPDGASTLIGCWHAVAYQIWAPLSVSGGGNMTIAELGSHIQLITQGCALAPTAALVSACESEAGRYIASTSRWDLDKAVQLCAYVAEQNLCRTKTTQDVIGTREQRGILD